MKTKIKKSRVMQSLIAALFMGTAPLAYSETVVDFSETTGYGTSSDTVQVNNIRVDYVTVNPFDPSHPSITSVYYNIPFVFDPTTLHLVPNLDGASQGGGTGTATGCADLSIEISDATTGSVIQGAIATISGNSLTSNSTGLVSFTNITEGSTSIGVAATGYTSASQVLTTSCSQATSVGIALNPAQSLSTGEIRIILGWGDNPADLDSHLTGPNAASNGSATDDVNRFHVYYGHRTEDVASLDVDDRSGRGPETVTIMPPTGSTTLRAGLYRYTVHDYSGSSNIASSPTTVRIIFSDGTERSFNAAASSALTGTKDTWTVFEFLVGQSGTVSLYQVMTYGVESSASSIRSTVTGYGSVETGVDFTRLEK